MKILHIGNIANNGYLNSRIMRRAGIESDNWSITYYHFMGYPEWEEGRIARPLDIEINPDWSRFGYIGPPRPKWFLIGSYSSIFSKSRSLNQDATRAHHPEVPGRYLLKIVNRTYEVLSDYIESTRSVIRSSALAKAAYLIRYAVVNGCDESINVIVGMPRSRFKGFILKFVVSVSLSVHRLKKKSVAPHLAQVESTLSMFDLRVQELCSISKELELNPELTLRPSDLESYRHIFPELLASITPYDLVVGYAYDGILPLLAGKVYIAFEHGTIRNLPFENTVSGRLCRLVYKLADKVYITNCDNNIAASKLGLKNFQFIPHPINEDISEIDRAEALKIRTEWNNQFGNSFVVFFPPRHHWSDQRHTDWDKGNDRLIMAIAEVQKRSPKKIILVTVELGRDVLKSKTLIDDLGLSSNVIWIKPVPHHQLVAYMLASDVVADQFNVPTFGGIPPKALMAGKPVLTSFEPSMHEWCFSSPPPFQATDSTPESIASALFDLLKDSDELQRLGVLGRQWYKDNYSNALILNQFQSSFRELLRTS